MAIDWSDLLRGVVLADLSRVLSSLDLGLQQQIAQALQQSAELKAALPPPPPQELQPSAEHRAAQPPPLPPSPWSVAAGSVAWLLEECQLSTLYGATFEEYGLASVHELISEGRDAMHTLLRELGVTRDHRDRLDKLAFSPRPCGASGGAFDPAFLTACRPLHVQHMGCENMGPLLYAFTRFLKPRRVLEVGAGYTSIWLLRALADNDAELEACSQALATDGYKVSSAEWMVDDFGASDFGAPTAPTTAPTTAPHTPSTAPPPPDFGASAVRSTLHAIDDMGAAEGGNRGSAHLVCEIAEALGLHGRLRLHEGCAYELASDSAWLASCGVDEQRAAAAVADAAVADATVADATVADAAVADATVADANVADATVADATVADAAAADATVADATGADAAVADATGADAAVADATAADATVADAAAADAAVADAAAAAVARSAADAGSAAPPPAAAPSSESPAVATPAAADDSLTPPPPPLFDLMWLDFGLGTGPRIDSFLDAWWPRLRPGGLLLMHSTLTNTVTRAWLEAQRERARARDARPHPGDAPGADAQTRATEGTPSPPAMADAGGGGGGGGGGDGDGARRAHLLEYETLSLLEPHKRYQNSVSIFQKRDGGWAEPVHTMYP